MTDTERPMPTFVLTDPKYITDLFREHQRQLDIFKKRFLDEIKKNPSGIFDGIKIFGDENDVLISLQSFHFKFDQTKSTFIGMGDGTVRKSKKIGDTIGRKTQEDSDLDLDLRTEAIPRLEAEKLIFEAFDLPEPDSKHYAQTSEGIKANTRSGRISDKRGTSRANILRNIAEGNPPKFGNIQSQDLRHIYPQEKETPAEGIRKDRALLIAIRDVTDRLADFKRLTAQALYLWEYRSLKILYPQVEVKLVAHHTIASETENEFIFFGSKVKGEAKSSSAYAHALKIVEDYKDFDIFPFHVFGGTNNPSDIGESIELARELARRSRVFGLVECRELESDRFVQSLISSFGNNLPPQFASRSVTSTQELKSFMKDTLCRKM